nr:flagellar biosynthetic protein FliO [Lysobacter panacisoli]
MAQPQKAPAFAKPSDGPGIGGAVFALILVVSLILGLGWLARRMPGVGRASNNALRVVGSLALGPRDRVVVVEAGSTQLLLGVSSSGIRHLHTLDAPLPVAQPSQGQNIATPFAQLLAQHFGKKP